MHGLTLPLTLISAFVPASAGAADASSQPHAQTVMIAQATNPPPVETAPPPPVGTAVAPAPGYAPPPPYAAAPVHRGLSIWGVLPYGYGGFGLGVGGRFALPLPISSLIPGGRIRDNWSLEFGADYYRYSGVGYLTYDYAVNWFLPVCGMMWNVWLNDTFAVYPKVEAGYHVGWVSGYPDGYTSPSYGGVFVSGAVGLIYKLGGGNVNLRAEAGYSGVKGGVGFSF